jgi:hypothetical protein
MTAEFLGMFGTVYGHVVLGSIVLVLGVALGIAGLRLVPKGEPGHGFVIGASQHFIAAY